MSLNKKNYMTTFFHISLSYGKQLIENLFQAINVKNCPPLLIPTFWLDSRIQCFRFIINVKFNLARCSNKAYLKNYYNSKHLHNNVRFYEFLVEASKALVLYFTFNSPRYRDGHTLILKLSLNVKSTFRSGEIMNACFVDY